MGIVLWVTFQSEIVIAGIITAQLSMIKFWHTVISAARKPWEKKETCSDISAQKLAFLRISDYCCDLDSPDQSQFAGNHQFCSGSSCFSLDRSKGKVMLKMVPGRIFLMGALQTGLQRLALMTNRLCPMWSTQLCCLSNWLLQNNTFSPPSSLFTTCQNLVSVCFHVCLAHKILVIQFMACLLL